MHLLCCESFQYVTEFIHMDIFFCFVASCHSEELHYQLLRVPSIRQPYLIPLHKPSRPLSSIWVDNGWMDGRIMVCLLPVHEVMVEYLCELEHEAYWCVSLCGVHFLNAILLTCWEMTCSYSNIMEIVLKWKTMIWQQKCNQEVRGKHTGL